MPFQRKSLERSLKTKQLRPEHQCRIKIMLLADEGFTKAKISQTLKCTQKTAQYWTAKAEAGKAHDWQDRPRGRPKITNDKYLVRLRELATGSPRDYGYPLKHWTGQWLSEHLSKELGITISDRHVNRLLKQMGLSTRDKLTDTNNLSNNNNMESSNIKLQGLSSVSASAST